MVKSANYQLLLGISFLYRVGAALFIRWRRVLVTIPIRLSIHAVCEAVTTKSSPHSQEEDKVDMVEEIVLQDVKEDFEGGIVLPEGEIKRKISLIIVARAPKVAVPFFTITATSGAVCKRFG